MYLEPVNILQFIFVFIAIFGALLIRHNARYLGLFYMAIFLAIAMSFNLLEELNITREYYLVTPVFTLIKGPAFYFFVYRLVFPERAFTPQHLIHGLPMLLALPLTSWPQFVIALGSLSQIAYAILVLKLIYQYHQASSAMRSDADALNLRWVVKVLFVYLFMGLFDLVRLNLQPYIPLTVNLSGQFIGTLFGLCLFAFLIYKAVRNPILFNGMQSYLDMVAEETKEKDDKAINSQIFNQLKSQILTDSLHHTPRLALQDLAKATGLNTRDISRAINLSSGSNFNDFINQLRIDDIKRSLDAPQANERNILEMALDVGFGSKSTFNAVFKRETGLTPSDYIKQLNK